MTTTTTESMPTEGGFLSRERTVAQPGFNRWLVPPAALAIHLCIGMAYGFSVFTKPLAQAIGLAKPQACAVGSTLVDRLFTTTCDWAEFDVTLIFSIFIVFLGLSAAVGGGWLERAGPRKAGVVSAFCWGGGFLISAYGIYIHQLWLMWLGSGVLGGIGLGLGYISPVSTLIKWFPDRRGMATGMAIMGFGGGAVIGSPLADLLINSFRTPSEVGVWQAFAVLGVVYFIFMMGGAFGYRVPPNGWQPEGWTPPAPKTTGMISRFDVDLEDAHKTPQFWLIWAVLFLNVAAGIGVLAVASPILQDIFGGALIGRPELSFSQLDSGQRAAIGSIAAGFAGLLSLFNIGGRLFWASVSDFLGRKATYAIFFALGIALYAGSPFAAHIGAKGVFVLCFCIILSMYGGGFATVPAYLADLFGTKYVGAIHGRLLTAWSFAGVVGPFVVSKVPDMLTAAGLPRSVAIDRTMFILAGMLAVGFIANLLVRPVAEKWHIATDDRVTAAGGTLVGGSFGIGRGGFSFAALLAWLVVGLPLAWGIYRTVIKSASLFT